MLFAWRFAAMIQVCYRCLTRSGPWEPALSLAIPAACTRREAHNATER